MPQPGKMTPPEAPAWVQQQPVRMAPPAVPQPPAMPQPGKMTPPEAPAWVQEQPARMAPPAAPQPPAAPALDEMPSRPEAPSWVQEQPAHMAPLPPPVPAYRPWGGLPYGGWAPPYGGGWNNGWAPWGNGWGGNSWSPWGRGWNDGWGGNNWWPWGGGWGNRGWNDAYGSGWGDGSADTWGDGAADGSGEADFSFAMRAWASGDLTGRGDAYGDGYGSGYGYGYEGYQPYYPPAFAPWPAAAPLQSGGPAGQQESTDADQDGVSGAGDLCPDTPAGVSVDAFGCDEAARIVLHGVHFRTDSDELTAESLAILDGVSATLTEHPQIRVTVAGHTDSDADEAYNKDLSLRRAQSVVNYLVAQGVNPENLTAMGYGEEQPIADNSTEEGKAQNRRVELNRL
jgi:outer membrane protein OmpA-like peptidoglycan-associated protein